MSKLTWQEKYLHLAIHHPALKTAADEVQYFCRDWIFGSKMERVFLILVGNPGCGKTHLLRAVERFCRGAQQLSHKKRSERTNDVLTRIPSINFMFWPAIAAELARNQDWPMREAIESDLLLWDDLGAENDPWKNIADRACQILSRREKKFTMITTNIATAQWDERFDRRISDRLLRSSIVVDLSEVPSYTTHQP